MADQDDMFVDDTEVDPGEPQGTQKRVGFLPGVLIQVLKWAGIILGVVIFVVTITVVTVRFISRGNPPETRIPTSEAYRADAPIYTWQELGELRGSTADDVRTTFIVEPALGYDSEAEQLTTELIQREIQLIGIFNDYFGARTTAELEGPQNKLRVEQELMDQINRILRNGQIRDIVFISYQFLPF